MQVYKALNPGLAVRVYFMVYQMTTEEHKYLASLRKEKDAFERLIRERGVRFGSCERLCYQTFPDDATTDPRKQSCCVRRR